MGDHQYSSPTTIDAHETLTHMYLNALRCVFVCVRHFRHRQKQQNSTHNAKPQHQFVFGVPFHFLHTSNACGDGISATAHHRPFISPEYKGRRKELCIRSTKRRPRLGDNHATFSDCQMSNPPSHPPAHDQSGGWWIHTVILMYRYESRLFSRSGERKTIHKRHGQRQQEKRMAGRRPQVATVTE